MKKNLLVIALFVSLLASGLFAYRWRKADAQRRETIQWTHALMDSLATTVAFPNPPYRTAERDSLYWRWVATMAEIKMRNWQGVVRHWVGLRQTLLEEYEIEELKTAGLTDPPRQLRESLVAHADLIPYPGVLGGTMSIDSDHIVLLQSPYAFAIFEDGHEQGSMLVSYSVQPGGRIEWKRLWAALE
jgi:hypothetical protein